MVLEVMKQNERAIHHRETSAESLGFAFKSGKLMVILAVRLLHDAGQIFAKKVSIFGSTPEKYIPFVRHKSAQMIVNFFNRPLA